MIHEKPSIQKELKNRVIRMRMGIFYEPNWGIRMRLGISDKQNRGIRMRLRLSGEPNWVSSRMEAIKTGGTGSIHGFHDPSGNDSVVQLKLVNINPCRNCLA